MNGRDYYGDLEPDPPAGGGPTLGDMLAAPGQAVIWCQSCTEPATGPDEFCDPHRAGVPAAITDPWLAKQYAQQLARRARR